MAWLVVVAGFAACDNTEMPEMPDSGPPSIDIPQGWADSAAASGDPEMYDTIGPPAAEEPAQAVCAPMMPEGQWTMISRRETPHGLSLGGDSCELIDRECSGSAPKESGRPMDLLFVLDDDCTYLLLRGLQPVGNDGIADMVTLERFLDESRHYEYPNYAGDLLDLEAKVVVTTNAPEIELGGEPIYLWTVAGGLYFGLGGGNAGQRLVSYNLPSPDCPGAVRLGTTRCGAGAIWYQFQ